MEFISMLTDLNTKDNGLMINSMDLELNIGVITPSMLDNMQTPKKKVKDSICGQMVTSTLGSGAKM